MPVDIIMPALEMSQDTGQLVCWFKSEGELVRQGEPLMEIETDKMVLEIQSPGTGVLTQVTAAPGEEIPVGKVIALLLVEGESAPESGVHPESQTSSQAGTPIQPEVSHAVSRKPATADQPTADQPTADQPTADQPTADQPTADQPTVTATQVRASPKARRLARELGIDLSTVVGTGPDGSIQTRDVQQHASGDADSTEHSEYTPQPIKGIRKVIAKRLQKSAQEAPHISLTLSVDMGQIQAELSRQSQHGEGAVKLSSMLCKAVAFTLAEHTRLNAHLVDNEIRIFRNVHLGVAVALEEGLVVPVIRDVGRKDIAQIQVEMAEFAGRARQRQLQLDEMKGATFTISNLGMYEVEHFTSIVNPPEVAILSAGAVREEPVAYEGRIEVRPRMQMTINCDHRAVDGAVAADFLRALKRRLETADVA